MKFKFNDGGRLAAGYKGHNAGDCVCRAISIATGQDYQTVYDKLNELGQNENFKDNRTKRSNARTGVFKETYKPYIESLGFEWVACMGRGTGCKVHLKPDELPNGILIVRLSRHLSVVIDGVLQDTYDCSRDGTRCVYGYWRKK
jgi:hypothetical protein